MASNIDTIVDREIDRIALDSRMRDLVYEAWDGKCQYCSPMCGQHVEREDAQVDHIIPLAASLEDLEAAIDFMYWTGAEANEIGEHELNSVLNYTLACAEHNNQKSNTLLPPPTLGFLLTRAKAKAPEILAKYLQEGEVDWEKFKGRTAQRALKKNQGRSKVVRYFHPEHKERLLDVALEHGYTSISDIARALDSQGHYQGHGVPQIEVRLSSYFSGQERTPRHAIREIQRICKFDTSLDYLWLLPNKRPKCKEGFLDKELSVELKEMLDERGYKTSKAVAVAMQLEGFYQDKTPKQLSGTLRKVYADRMKIPVQMADALLRVLGVQEAERHEMYGNNSVVDFLVEHSNGLYLEDSSPNPITVDEEQRFIELYSQDLPYSKISKTMGRDPNTLGQLRKRLGLPRRR